jgi:hypothetical protein
MTRQVLNLSVRAALIAMLCTGCRDVTGLGEARGNEPLQTDRLEYEAVPFDVVSGYTRYEFTVVAVFRNVTDQTVYLDRCASNSPGPIYGTVPVDSSDSWGSAWNQGWACGAYASFELQPSQTRTDTLRLRGPMAFAQGAPLGVLEGRFRIFYNVRYCPAECPAKLPDSLRTSNVFVVKTKY